MAIRANPKLIEELERYGAADVSNCYHCGNCSATCPFSSDRVIFPRREMRMLQMGLETKLESSLDPWLCYYCGECSDECPRDAEPGETMMSLRRWLTSRYDWTGLSRLFYRSWRAELTAILIVALLAGAGFLAAGFLIGGSGGFDAYGSEDAFLPAGNTVAFFIPTSGVHLFDWILAAVLVFFLGSNCIRMWWKTMGRDKSVKVPLYLYFVKIFTLPWHFVTQARYAQCERKRPWVVHLVLMLSYVTMLVLIMLFLEYMVKDATDWRVHAFGLVATAGLLATTIFALRGRIKKTETHYQHSHESDWMFLILLIIVVSTGFIQFVMHRLAGADAAANVVYIIHLMAVVPMLALEVPFSKWSHLAYRPLAMYFEEVREEAATAAEKSAVPLGAAQAA